MHAASYWRLSSFYFAYFVVLGSFTPYWSLWLHDQGLSPWWIAALMGSSWLTRVLAPPVWGAAASAAERPRRWLLAGCLLTLASFAGLLSAPGLPALVVLMLAFTFFYNAVLPQFEALTLSHLRQQPSAYGRIRLWGSIGFIVAVVLMGLLLDHVAIHWLPWLMLPGVLALAISATVNDYGPAVQGFDRLQAATTLRERLRDHAVLGFFAMTLLMQAAHGPFYVFFSLHLEQLGYGRGSIGALWALGVLAEICMFVVAGAWLRRLGAARMLMICLAAAVLRWSLVGALAANPLALGLSQLMHALTFAAFHAAAIDVVNRLFPGSLANHGQGLLYGLGSGVGGVLGALLAGLAWTHGGGSLTFTAAAVTAALGVVVALLSARGLSRLLARA